MWSVCHTIQVIQLPDRLMVGRPVLVRLIGVRVPVWQQPSETYQGLQKSYSLQRILKMSHGLEFLLKLLKIRSHYVEPYFWFESEFVF